VLSSEKRAIEAEARVQRESRRANDAQERVHELTERVHELEATSAEHADELAIWHSGVDAAPVGGEMEAVLDLLAWEQRVAAAHHQAPEQKQA
jgi:polyphosphate kinase 2 (PPK2 family)